VRSICGVIYLHIIALRLMANEITCSAITPTLAACVPAQGTQPLRVLRSMLLCCIQEVANNLKPAVSIDPHTPDTGRKTVTNGDPIAGSRPRPTVFSERGTGAD